MGDKDWNVLWEDKRGVTIIPNVDPSSFRTEDNIKRWLCEHIRGKIERLEEELPNRDELKKLKKIRFLIPEKTVNKKTPDGRSFGEVLKEYTSMLENKYKFLYKTRVGNFKHGLGIEVVYFKDAADAIKRCC